jgi:hypothetical protein
VRTIRPPRATRLRAVALVLIAAGAGMGARAKPTARSGGRCASEGPRPGPGSLDPFRPPAPKAVELNAAGKIPYRQGKWEEARAQYRAAETADPEFLAPKLNIACSLVRQERFAEATSEVVALLGRAYVPWAKEILDAADLGALKVRPEMKEIQHAMAASAARWAEGLDASVLFVARQRPPLRIPDGPGVFILNPHQEVWAYSPRTQRYRQLTTEDGHVVALARSPDRRRIAYVTAEKLVRGAPPGALALRGVAIHELALGTMAKEGDARVAADVRHLEVLSRDATFLFRVGGELLHLATRDALTPLPEPRILAPPLVVLTGAGVEPVAEGRSGNPCRLPETGLTASYGAGLGGLPIP